MIYCFDLDGTLVTDPVVPNDYSTTQPISENINVVRELKRRGHKIIINTSRRMKTYNGNVGAALRDIGLVTLQSLQAMNIPYDEIFFGKPYADYYIDDKAMDAFACYKLLDE